MCTVTAGHVLEGERLLVALGGRMRFNVCWQHLTKDEWAGAGVGLRASRQAFCVGDQAMLFAWEWAPRGVSCRPCVEGGGLRREWLEGVSGVLWVAVQGRVGHGSAKRNEGCLAHTERGES
jgi:hypothetical protein